MRKLFWVCLASAVLLVAGVFTVAQIAIRHPQSFCGRLLFGASHVAAALDPFQTFSTFNARIEKIARAESVKQVPCTPTEPVCPLTEAPAPIVEAAPIVIPEDEPLLRTVPPTEQTLTPVEYSTPFHASTECPPSDTPKAPPALMPYADEEETCEEQPSCPGTHCQPGCPHRCGQEPASCPKADVPEEEYELLPMPAAEEEQEEEHGTGCCPTGAAGMLLRLFEKMMKKGDEQPAEAEATETPECREDHHYHHHYSGCPYTGRSYCPSPHSDHHCPPMPPAVEPEKPAVPGGEEGSEEGSKSALKKIRSFKFKFEMKEDDYQPVHPRVDTLEMRPEDGQLYDYGPGVL